MKIFIISTPQQILLGGQSQNGKDRRGHVTCLREKKIHTRFWWENLREIDRLEGLGVNDR